jgi:hypothetical protein
MIDLMDGSLSPGLVSFGAHLGLVEIEAESSANDGVIYDMYRGKVPEVIGGQEAVIHAIDGLSFGGRDTLYVLRGFFAWIFVFKLLTVHDDSLAYRGGVTASVTPPVSSGPFAGLSVGFNPGASHSLEKGAIIQDTAALHISVGHLGGSRPSVSTQIAALRNMLLHPDDGERGQWLKLVLKVFIYSTGSRDDLLILTTYAGLYPTCRKYPQSGPYRNPPLSETRSRRNDADIDQTYSGWCNRSTSPGGRDLQSKCGSYTRSFASVPWDIRPSKVPGWATAHGRHSDLSTSWTQRDGWSRDCGGVGG